MSKLTVQIASWNVNCKKPSLRMNLKKWLSQLSPSPDIICVGFQELLSQLELLTCFPSQQALFYENVRYGGDIHGLETWISLVLEAVEEIHGHGPNYKIFWAGRRAGFGMIIALKEGIMPVSIYTGSIGTGVGGIYGNKGAIGCCLEFAPQKVKNPTTFAIQSPVSPGTVFLQTFKFTFINSHLGPHEGESCYRWRVEESDHILACLLLNPFPSPTNPSEPFVFNNESLSSISALTATTTPSFSILPQDAEVIFFFGDLNFRLKGDTTAYGLPNSSTKQPLPSRNEIMRLINEGSINQLLEMDELIHLISEKHGVLSQFQEEKIDFLPSYKFDLISGRRHADFDAIPTRDPIPISRTPSYETSTMPRSHSSKSLNSNPPMTCSRVYSGKRLPAYCDRILYFADHRYILTPLDYTCRSYEFSDHNPVMGVYHLERVEGESKVLVKRSGVMGMRLWRFLSSSWKIGLLLILFFAIIEYLQV